MAKRKAGVQDIIYELDNDDIELSSEDEGKDAKINRLETENSIGVSQNECKSDENNVQVTSTDCPPIIQEETASSPKSQNGGKSSPAPVLENNTDLSNDRKSPRHTEVEVDNLKRSETSKTTIFNEDIVVDSPASNSDLGVVGCENRTPLVTVRFRDNKLANSYKDQIKSFMLKLIKLHENEDLSESETETDLELDIWPEDLHEEEIVKEKEEDNLFFVDTAPTAESQDEVPNYKLVSTVISNTPTKEPTPPPVLRRVQSCFNCNGAHQLRDCPLPRNNSRIAENRKNLTTTRVGRYHVEDEQKYGHLNPGRISGQLRHALGLKRHELPLHIYRMRLLGYPPGWLEEARISHSGITMFDSTVNIRA